jgi:hypothetical protein
VLLHKANHRSKYGFRIWSGFVSKELGIVFCVSHPSLDFSDEMECVIKDALLDPTKENQTQNRRKLP